MRVYTIALILCVIACVTADVAHIKATKAKLLSHIAGKHHKRGILSHVPPYKLGHDIPLVTHSVVKPVIVNYPPTAAVATVKVPLTNPLVPRYPVPVGHKVPGLPHPHYALRFPHTKYYVKPDHHFHHHHHHVQPKPILPVVHAIAPAAPPPPVVHAAPVAPAVPVPQPTATLAQHIPAPPPVIFPSPILPAQAAPIPPPPVHVFPHSNFLKPLLPAATIPLAPAAVLPPPLFRGPQQYVIRPGGAVQTSYFATYPRYPFINSYQAPIYPLPNAFNGVQSIHQLMQPHNPHFHVLPQAAPHEGSVEHHHNVLLEQTPTLIQPTHEPQPAVHLHPTQETFAQPTFNVQPVQPTQLIPQPSVHLQPTQPTIPVEHDGWSPVPAQPQDTAHHDVHYPQQHHFVQEQAPQVYEHHDDQYHDFQHQIQQHIQQQIEQAQYEQSLNNQHQLNHEYGTPQPAQEYGQPNQYQVHDFTQQAHDFAQQAQDFAHNVHDFSQGHDFSQNGQDFSHTGQDFSHNGQDFSQHGQQYPQQQFSQNDFNVAQPGQEYGVPQQGAEGRNAEDEGAQFHNHIPLALQPPIDRPLDHFQ
ncbi:RNA-binding protein 33-like [Colias croceus]|uniref:RNA-binding protein 33-like n=1 Tax=Colias crocea TaxID=72248 RepID=UPI001E280AF0|nr:RNA-binding protein 33-like [Colias croceus]